MRAKKGTPEAKKHGHADNQFHTVEQPGFNTSFYIKGEEVKTLILALELEERGVNKSEIATLAKQWFSDMMKTKKRQLSKRVKNSSQNT